MGVMQAQSQNQSLDAGQGECLIEAANLGRHPDMQRHKRHALGEWLSARRTPRKLPHDFSSRWLADIGHYIVATLVEEFF